MRFKKVIFMMVLVLCMSSSSSVFANEVKYDVGKGSYQPMWSNVGFLQTYVEETSLGLDACATIVPNNNQKVKGTLYLQKYRNGYWSTMTSWKFSGRGYTEVCKSYSASSGKYRTKLSVNVGGEYITSYSNSKKIN